MSDVKPWYASKTLWVNGLTIIAAVSGAVGFDLGLTTEVQTQIVVGILAVANVVLRLTTKTAVGK